MTDFAKEGGHWYDRQGKPVYTYINKKGGESAVTLRQARIEYYLPSVTGVLGILDKPGLNRWKENQILMSALTLPKIDGESIDSFAKRVNEDSRKQATDARDKGTLIHGEIEKYFSGKGCADKYVDLCNLIEKSIFEKFGPYQFSIEKSFACEDGYGGKVDMFSNDFDGLVIDFKTTEFAHEKPPPGYPEQCQQLAAYRNGLNLPDARVANIFVSTLVDGIIYIREWEEDELKDGLDVFLSALNIWKILKKYDPKFKGE